MKLLDAAATWMMRIVTVTTPQNRSEWARAMMGEFASLEGNAHKLAWAVGCAGTALWWRLRMEAVYLAGLTLLPFAWEYVLSPIGSNIASFIAFGSTGAIVRGPPSAGEVWLHAWMATSAVSAWLLAFVLCMYRPRWAVFTSTIVWFMTTGASFFMMMVLPMLADPLQSEGNHPHVPNWVMTFLFLGSNMWPSILGGGAGWALGRGKRLLSAAAACAFAALLVTNLTRPIGGGAYFSDWFAALMSAALFVAIAVSFFAGLRTLASARR